MITENNTSANLLTTKPHFEILDGLRGVAAMVVVLFHFLEVVYTDPSTNFAGHGFMAVDFFFCLSGFVIAYAYDNRMEKIGFKSFFRLRLIRLHPLVLLGAVLGLLAFLFDPFGVVPPGYGFIEIALLFLTAALLIPYPVMPERYFNLVSFNAPAWSLFWEYVANIAYGLFLWKTNRRILILIALTGAVTLAIAGFGAGNLMGGWGKSTFWHGFSRICYSFAAGMLVFRYNLVIRNKLGFLGLTVLLLLALLMPYTNSTWNVVAELIAVLLYFPLLVALGAGAQLHKRLSALCAFSGKISYPLYMTHYMVIWSFANYYGQYKPNTQQLAMVITAGMVILLAFAWLAMRFYDEPLRAWLRRKQ